MMEENGLPRGWVETTLGEVSKVQTGPFGSQLLNEQYITGGTPVVTVEHIDDFRIIDFDYPSVTVEDKKRLSKYLLKEGDIIFTRVGSVDLSAYVAKEQDGWMFSSRMLSVRTNSYLDSKFLSYFFRQISFRKYIHRISVGATMPSINTSILKSIPISYPPKQEQKAIASILTSFDDKIELLQAQNETLETIAQTIFKEWFGKYQVGDELPEGWRVGKLGDAVNIKQGKYVKPSKISETKSEANKFPVYGGGGIRGYLSDYIYGTPQVVLTCRGNGCGLIQLSESYSTVTNSCMALEDIDSELNFIYIYLQSQNLDFESVTSGSAQPQITVTNLRGTEIIIPNESVLLEFNDVAKPLFQKMSFNTIQIQTLQQTRDTLLPKLMSGKVRVDEFKE